MSRLVYVLNGPNLNLLGKRQPHIYGAETLADVEAACRKTARELKLEIEFHQSNAEFQIIDWIHEARERAGGIVINPAALTHTSVAVLDALNTVEFPIIEVHISNMIAGFGTQGYTLALQRLAYLIDNAKS
jgi:3-dehydroquinate dehydratase-2